MTATAIVNGKEMFYVGWIENGKFKEEDFMTNKEINNREHGEKN